MGTPNLFATASCCFLIVLAPHALGGATPVGSWLIAAAACIALIAALTNAREFERKRFLVPAGWAALALHLLTMLQAAPLPCSVVSLLAPGSVANTLRASKLLGEHDPQFCSLSFDIGATQASLAWTTTLLCSLFAFAILVQLGGRWYLLVSVASSSALVALVALLHKVGGIDALYGVYHPIYVQPRVLGPLLNENHLGAFISLGVPVMIALGLDAEAKSYGAFWFIAASGSAGTAILTLSRGAFAMLALELVLLMCFMAIYRTRRRGRSNSRLLVALVPSAAGMALGLFAVGEQVFEEFRDGSSEKLAAIWSGFKFTLNSPWLGVGRGAFASAFTRVLGSTDRHEYVESLVVQWAADWGWPLALLVLTWVAWWMTRSLAKAGYYSEEGHDVVHAAGVIALVSLGFQNLVDFNIDLPGVIAPTVALFVACVVPTREQQRDRFVGDRFLAKPIKTDACTAMLAPAAVGFAVCVWQSSSDVPFEELQRQVQSRAASHEMLGSLKQSLRRHPSDARFALLGASVATAAQVPEAGEWVSYSRQLAPGWAGPRLLDAYQKLIDGDAEAAALELRAATELDPMGDGGLTCTIAFTLETFQSDVTRIVPNGRGGIYASERLSACQGVSEKTKRRVDALVARANPNAPAPSLRLAQNPKLSAEQRIQILAPIAASKTGSAGVYGLLASAYDASGKPELADDCLKQGLIHSEPRYFIYDFIAARHGAAGRTAAMRDAIRSMRAEAADRAVTLADSYAREAMLESSFGDLRVALEAFEKAYRQVPRKEWLHQLLSIAARLGDSVKVKWARIVLCREGDRASCPPTDSVDGAAYQAQGYTAGEPR